MQLKRDLQARVKPLKRINLQIFVIFVSLDRAEGRLLKLFLQKNSNLSLLIFLLFNGLSLTSGINDNWICRKSAVYTCVKNTYKCP